MLKKFSIAVLSVLAAVFLAGCQAGLGEEVDLEAPVVKIISPVRNTYVPKSIDFAGTASDNKKVTKVELSEIKTSNGKSTKVHLCNADVGPDGQWFATVELDEGEKTVYVEAFDKAGNTSMNSYQQMTLLVDETAPEGLAWYIDRGNSKQTVLQDLETLKALDLSKSSNVDYPQNVSFTVYGSMYDAMSIKEVKLYISEEGDLDTTIVEKSNDAGSNLYSPEFSFTHDELAGIKPSLATGKHYLHIDYYSEDQQGNYDTKDLGWFIWYPESDYPNFDRSIADSVTNTIIAHVNSSVTIDIFDDDELDYVYTGLISAAKYDEKIEGSTLAEKEKYLSGCSDVFLKNTLGLTPTVLSGGQIISVQAQTGGTPGKYYLAAFGCDGTSNSIKSACLIPATVSDDNVPILFIESPEENTVPAIDSGENSKFTISGYSLDTTRTDSVKVCFIPDQAYASNAAKRNAAQALLKADSTSAGSSTANEDGTKIWNLSLTDEGVLSQGTTSWKKQSFTLTCDLLSDFNYNGSLENDVKFLEFQVTDNDGNAVYQDYKLEGDTTEPEITPNHDDMFLCDYTTDDGLTLSFSAVKSTGLGIKSDSYKITRIISSASGNEEKVLVKGTSFKYTKAQLEEMVGSDTQPKFRFYASDLLGNQAVAQRTVVLTALPSLSKVTSDAMDGTYKAGDKITVTAMFTKPVKVTGTPTLTLKWSESDSTVRSAVYSGGSGTDSLKFSYTVPSGAVSSKLYCADSPVVLPSGAKIETAESTGGDAHLTALTSGNRLQDTKNIALDGVSPEIENVYITCEGEDSGSFKEGKEIKVIVSCSENVLVSGSPSFVLACGSGSLTGSFQGVNGKLITFTHKITSADTNAAAAWNSAKCFSSADLAYITDTNGNQLSLASSGTLTTSSIYIDTKAPSVPSLAFAPGTLKDGGVYNKTQTLTLSSIETNATAYYSIDGGLAWKDYSSAVSLETGTYKVCAKQTDKAGNTSVVSTIYSVDINSQFPEITDFACNAADGNYPKGSVLTFKMSFASKVKSTSAPTLTLFNSGSGKTAAVTAETTGSTSLTFTYTVAEGDSYEGLKVVSADLTGVTDLYGNTPADDAAASILTASGTRSGIIIDAVSPALTAFTPKDSSGTSPVIAKNGNVITLTFSENVYKESGTITLKRTAGWAIPAVLTEDEFNSVYNELDSDDKELLELTENGSAKLNSKTGLPVGPYRKITHGLTLSGGNYVPDTSTKYVLDFNLGLYDGQATVDGNTFDVSKIRGAFENAGYHQQTLDVTSSSVVVSGSTVTITFPDTLVDGREWEFTVDEGAFRDKTGNTTAAIDKTFWSAKAAQPVVRVDRYSHGWGASEPDASGNLTTISTFGTAYNTANSGASIAPTGYCRVRIDCETPDASIYYKKIENLTYTDNVTAQSTSTKAGTSVNASQSDLESGFTGTAYSSFIVTGDGLLNTTRRDYITAYAKKDGFDNSSNGFEGVFKTLVLHYESGSKDIITIEGGTSAGGMPVISGFPLRDATLDHRYGKNAYTPQSGDNTKKVWYWISYEIVSDFSEMGKVGNYTQNYYTTSYGLCTHIYNVAWY